MAKKVQKTIYLEEINMEFLKQYQEKYRLSTISVALDHIIFSLMINGSVEGIKFNNIKNNIDSQKGVPKSIINIKNSMRD